ncbi:uncharacterized protein LOC121110124 isoform X1 [Gallus gallus]|uniref:uncharacterized protein LOC121110124 isoform X1 n=1 Tax=Gallus gallus TaxID=9031 RepID=UPI001AE39A3C|nr:uncharacterized protein LOC121110124 isoform X1 [Gallus gallus]
MNISPSLSQPRAEPGLLLLFEAVCACTQVKFLLIGVKTRAKRLSGMRHDGHKDGHMDSMWWNSMNNLLTICTIGSEYSNLNEVSFPDKNRKSFQEEWICNARATCESPVALQVTGIELAPGPGTWEQILYQETTVTAQYEESPLVSFYRRLSLDVKRKQIFRHRSSLLEPSGWKNKSLGLWKAEFFLSHTRAALSGGLEGSGARASLLSWKDDLAVLSDLDQAPETFFGLKGLALQPCECHQISRTLSELASPYPTSALCWWVSHPAAVSAEGHVAEGCPPCLQSQNDRIPPVGRDSRGLPNPTPGSTQHHSNHMSESTVQTFLEVCLVSELQRMRG